MPSPFREEMYFIHQRWLFALGGREIFLSLFVRNGCSDSITLYVLHTPMHSHMFKNRIFSSFLKFLNISSFMMMLAR